MPSPPRPVTAGDVLTLDELRELRQTSALRGAGLVAHAWALIGAAMLLCAARPGLLTGILAVAVIGSRQLGLMVLAHEAAHWRLFPHPRANNVVATWLCAFPIWGELPGYRRRHHLHHRHLLETEDPDRALAQGPPLGWRRLAGAALRDLGGWTAAARLLALGPGREGAAGAWRRWRGPALANGVLLGALAGLGHWHLYFLLWVVPLVTWYPLVARLRDAAEHALVADPADPLRNARTIPAGPVARLFLAPYWVSYHLEHHLLVFVPCWKLRRAHALLLARGHGARMEVAATHVEVVRRLGRARA